MPVGPKLRFDVFKRDAFTCQYCGRRAPDVILYLDHVIPACQGGKDVKHNLVTACEACNLGKSGRLLLQIAAGIPLSTREAAAFLVGYLSAGSPGMLNDRARAVSLESLVVLRRHPERVDEEQLRKQAAQLLEKWIERRDQASRAMEVACG
jgi:hypothetical protein